MRGEVSLESDGWKAAAGIHGHYSKKNLKNENRTEMSSACRTESEVKGARPNAELVERMKVTNDNSQLPSTKRTLRETEGAVESFFVFVF